MLKHLLEKQEMHILFVFYRPIQRSMHKIVDRAVVEILNLPYAVCILELLHQQYDQSERSICEESIPWE